MATSSTRVSLSENSLIEQYLKAAASFPFQDFSSLQTAIRSQISTLCKTLSIPEVEVKFKPEEEMGEGEFEWQSWTMEAGVKNPTADQPNFTTFVGMLYHETRHAEQAYRAAQAGLLSWQTIKSEMTPQSPATIQMVTKELQVPETVVVDAAKGLNLLKDNDKEGFEWYEARKSKANDQLQNDVNKAGIPIAEAERVVKQKAQAMHQLVTAIGATTFTGNDVVVAESLEKALEKAKKIELKAVDDLFKEAKLYYYNYRNISYERDAHLLGWQVEDRFAQIKGKGWEPARTGQPALPEISNQLFQACYAIERLGDFLVLGFDPEGVWKTRDKQTVEPLIKPVTELDSTLDQLVGRYIVAGKADVTLRANI